MSHLHQMYPYIKIKDGTNSLHVSSFCFLISTKSFLKARKCQVVTPCSGTITNLNAVKCWYAR